MNGTIVKIVRIYVTEGDDFLPVILEYLHHTLKVRGATVFRGITGFGHSGEMHESRLLTMSLNLPLTIEFFDTLEKVSEALAHLAPIIGESHMVSWEAVAY